MTSARVLLLLPRQLTMPFPLRLALAPPSQAPARGYFLMVLQQPHRCWARAAAASSASSSSCEQYPQAPIAAAPGATCPRLPATEREREREKRRCAAARRPRACSRTIAAAPARHPRGLLRISQRRYGRRAAAATGRKGRSGSAPSRQRGRTAKPQVNKPARTGTPKQGRGGGGGIIHDVPRSSSSSASTTSPSSSSTASSTRLRATKKQDSED